MSSICRELSLFVYASGATSLKLDAEKTARKNDPDLLVLKTPGRGERKTVTPKNITGWRTVCSRSPPNFG